MFGGQSLRFGPAVTPEIIKQLMIANVVVFTVQQLFPAISDLGAVNPINVWQEGYVWQPFTYMWLHGGFMHIAMNCFGLWMFGSELALEWGRKEFLSFYLQTGIGAGFIIASWPYVVMLFPGGADIDVRDTFTLGASGAVYAIVLAFSLTWPDRTIQLIFPPVSFRAIWLIPGFLVITIMTSGSEGNISHIGHLGGVLVGWLYLRHRGVSGPASSSNLNRRGDRPTVPSSNPLKRRWRRYRMRKKLRAVQIEKTSRRNEDQDRNDSDVAS